MPQVYICNRCAETINGDKDDWVILSMDTSGSAGLQTRAHAECEVRRLKDSQTKGIQVSRYSASRPAGADQGLLAGRTRAE
jgi:hypothetical protein